MPERAAADDFGELLEELDLDLLDSFSLCTLVEPALLDEEALTEHCFLEERKDSEALAAVLSSAPLFKEVGDLLSVPVLRATK